VTAWKKKHNPAKLASWKVDVSAGAVAAGAGICDDPPPSNHRRECAFMGSMSIWHWLVVLVVLLLLFGGRGKIPNLMGDFAKGIKAFKSGLKEPEEASAPPAAPAQPRAIEGEAKPVESRDAAAKH
jgi:sec-independent protein translocase protein TatA